MGQQKELPPLVAQYLWVHQKAALARSEKLKAGLFKQASRLCKRMTRREWALAMAERSLQED